MIFNKNNNGNEEFRQLTGTWYLNNTFDKITTDIKIETAELCKIISKPVYKLAEDFYQGKITDPDYRELVSLVQLSIATIVTLRMCQKNDISHEDTGRKVKIDSQTEKIPWQWQLDKDDQLQLDGHYRAVDLLIDYLNDSDIEEWHNSEQKKAANLLFIKNTDLFNDYYPIGRSGRMYQLLLPFIKEAERRYIKPALGIDVYNRLLQGEDLSEKEESLLEYVYPPIPLIAMSLAIRRMPLGIIPQGVVRNYSDGSQTMNASSPANLDEIKKISAELMADGQSLINEMKRENNGTDRVYPIMPNNDPRNKYFIA